MPSVGEDHEKALIRGAFRACERFAFDLTSRETREGMRTQRGGVGFQPRAAPGREARSRSSACWISSSVIAASTFAKRLHGPLRLVEEFAEVGRDES